MAPELWGQTPTPPKLTKNLIIKISKFFPRSSSRSTFICVTDTRVRVCMSPCHPLVLHLHLETQTSTQRRRKTRDDEGVEINIASSDPWKKEFSSSFWFFRVLKLSAISIVSVWEPSSLFFCFFVYFWA